MGNVDESRLGTISEIVARALDISINAVATPGFQLDNDSLSLLEMQMDVEDEFGVEIPDEEAQGWKTIQDIDNSVTRAIGNDIGNPA